MKTQRSFLIFSGYYRRFVKDYAKLVKPLKDLLIGHPTNKKVLQNHKKKNIPWQRGELQQAAFDILKLKLLTPPVLAYADFSKPFVIHTDASRKEQGVVLYQEQNGKERVIGYASRGLCSGKKNYPAH